MRLKAIIAGLIFLALAGLGGFYLLTIPVPAVTGPLPARTADLANGETMFHIGGCAACHATPKPGPKRKTEPVRLGGGLALATPFGTFKAPNISPDPVARDRRLERGGVRQRHAARHRPQRRAPLSGVPLYLLPAHGA